MDKKFHYKKAIIDGEECVVVSVSKDYLKDCSLEDAAQNIIKQIKEAEDKKPKKDTILLKPVDLQRIITKFSGVVSSYLYDKLEFDKMCDVDLNVDEDEETGKIKLEVKVYEDETKTKILSSYSISNY